MAEAKLRGKIVQLEAKVADSLAAYHEAREQLEGARAELGELVDARTAARPSVDWAARSFPWTEGVERLLATTFAIAGGYRPLQREAINATLSGRDAMVLMPTGGGKSLVYQLPAVYESARSAGRTTLVVSPLVALMMDQVAQLRQLGIAAELLTQQTPADESKRLLASLGTADAPPLLYVTPERVAQSKAFLSRLEKASQASRLARIVVDECHCISQWGHDWRRDYVKLGILREQLPGVPILALTATATARVRRDVQSSLLIQGCELFTASVDRPNLRFQALPKPDGAAEAAALVVALVRGRFSEQAGIVYVFSKKEADALAASLVGAGVRAQVYHADLSLHDADGVSGRHDVHARWADGRTHVVVATVAFGMGVNHSHVRFVLHHSMPRSVSALYQEAGRAGRDGRPAACIVLYRPADMARQCGFAIGSGRRREAVEAECFEVVRFCEALLGEPQAAAGAWGLARVLLQRHFGEALHGDLAELAAARGLGVAPGAGGAQRECIDLEEGGEEPASVSCGGPLVDLTADARALAQIVRAVCAGGSGAGGSSKRLTLAQLEAVWKGTGRKAEYGLGAAPRADPALSKAERERRIIVLVLEGALQLEYAFTAYAVNVYIACGRRADGVLAGREQVRAPLPAAHAEPGSGERADAAAPAATHKRKAAAGARRIGAGGKACRAADPEPGDDGGDSADDFEDQGGGGPASARRAAKAAKGGAPRAQK